MTEDVRALDERQCSPQGTWEQQWEQVRIGSQRVSAVYAGRWDNISDAVFDIRAFFLTCHHLGEWISGDETVPQAVRDRVGEVVESSVDLHGYRERLEAPKADNGEDWRLEHRDRT